MHFAFATAGRIVFGSGCLEEIRNPSVPLGRRVLVVGGRNIDRTLPVQQHLREAGHAVEVVSIAGEPRIEDIEAGVTTGREFGAESVVGYGGGSALDAGKAIAAMMTNEGELLDYLEVIGRGKPLQSPPAPMIAVPTTGGTGAEVTRNAVLGAPKHHVKVSLRHHEMLPRIALVDPKLALKLPAEVTARTGLDALAQLIEAFVSRRANPLTDAMCREGIRFAAVSLRRAYQSDDDLHAREGMALAAMLSGLALANAGLGAVHGLAGPLGGAYPAPHGAICAALLVPVTETNLHTLRHREPNHPSIKRYQEVATLLTGKSNATAEEGIEWLRQLVSDLEIPGLWHYRVASADFPSLVEKSQHASSMQGNPIPLEAEEIEAILQRAL